MLLDGHELNGVVAGIHDPRQDVGGKFTPRTDPFRILGHADVTLVNQRRPVRPREIRMPPPVR